MGKRSAKLHIGLLLMLLLCLAFAVHGEEPPEDIAPQDTSAPDTAATQPPDHSWLSDSGILRLVNLEQRITKDYEPHDLVVPKVATRKKGMDNNIRLREEAARALQRMFTAAEKEAGHVLYAASGYRSFGIQQILFSSKVEAVGSKEKAQKTVAPAGTSEHQLGLAIDIQSPSQLNLNRQFGDTEEGKWAQANAHRFGFILRYKREWTEQTGYLYEPWHFRYVGLAHARAIYALDIPYETYLAQMEKLPEYVLQGASDLLLIGLYQQMSGAEQPASFPQSADSEGQAAALRAATLPYLPEGKSYEEVLWAIYPTPKPTAGPRVDLDEESLLFSLDSHGLSP